MKLLNKTIYQSYHNFALMSQFWRHHNLMTQLAPPRVRTPPIGQIMHFSVARSDAKSYLLKIQFINMLIYKQISIKKILETT